MLSQVITHAVSAAEDVARLAGLPAGAPQAAIGHARSFVDTVVPTLKQTQVRAGAFAAETGTAVSRLLEEIEQGASPAGLEGRLASLADHARALSSFVDEADGKVGQTRSAFADDAGLLVAEEIRLSAETTVAAAEQRRLDKEARKIRARIRTVDKLSGLNPFIKLGSELANLITKRKTTEQSLADATRGLQQARARSAGLGHALGQVRSLTQLVQQLASGTQDLKNSLALIMAKLASEKDLLAATREEATLFLTALETSVGQLEDLVA